jgi:hypothetical protein
VPRFSRPRGPDYSRSLGSRGRSPSQERFAPDSRGQPEAPQAFKYTTKPHARRRGGDPCAAFSLAPSVRAKPKLRGMFWGQSGARKVLTMRCIHSSRSLPQVPKPAAGALGPRRAARRPCPPAGSGLPQSETPRVSRPIARRASVLECVQPSGAFVTHGPVPNAP